MKRRNILKDDKAVSPVIATILMVAITVVLAATLYMMLPGADDAGTPVSGNISAEITEITNTEPTYNVTINFHTMGTPSRPALDTIEVYVDGEIAFENGDVAEDDTATDYDTSFLTGDDELRSGASLTLEGFDSEPVDGVTVFFDGYDGSLSADF